jgi:hypothetical protein
LQKGVETAGMGGIRTDGFDPGYCALADAFPRLKRKPGLPDEGFQDIILLKPSLYVELRRWRWVLPLSKD